MQFVLGDKSVCSRGAHLLEKETAFIPVGGDDPGGRQALAHLLQDLKSGTIRQIRLDQDVSGTLLCGEPQCVLSSRGDENAIMGKNILQPLTQG